MIKRISGFAFGIAFLMIIIIFTDIGTKYIASSTARTIFMISGGIALFLNLINFQDSRHNPFFSFVYWVGSIVVFVGLVFFIMHWPYSMEIFIGGMLLTGASFFIPASRQKKNDSELLDDF